MTDRELTERELEVAAEIEAAYGRLLDLVERGTAREVAEAARQLEVEAMDLRMIMGWGRAR